MSLLLKAPRPIKREANVNKQTIINREPKERICDDDYTLYSSWSVMVFYPTKKIKGTNN
jgi:hypothetical protein